MHRPVLVTAPDMLPVSLAEAKAHLRVDHDTEDALIEALVGAAVSHLDGWTGILGICLVEQEWRQDFDGFGRCLALPLGPVISIESVTWRDEDGVETTIAEANYDLVTDAGGRSRVRFKDAFALPSGLAEHSGVSVSYVAGFETIPEAGETPAESTVPAAIKAAILLFVGAWYENREETVIGTIASPLPESVATRALLAPWRKIDL